jgi:hypothetical protein
MLHRDVSVGARSQGALTAARLANLINTALREDELSRGNLCRVARPTTQETKPLPHASAVPRTSRQEGALTGSAAEALAPVLV